MATECKILLMLLSFLTSCDNNLDMGMEYQKVLLAEKGNTRVYCYHLVWALDAEAYYISSNQDVCMGFDSTKDYCYGKGNQEIYYKYEDDSLKIYSYGSKPTLPKINPLNLSLTNLDFLSLDKIEEKVKNKEIAKVSFDSLYKVPCSPISKPFNLMDMKFK